MYYTLIPPNKNFPERLTAYVIMPSCLVSGRGRKWQCQNIEFMPQVRVRSATLVAGMPQRLARAGAVVCSYFSVACMLSTFRGCSEFRETTRPYRCSSARARTLRKTRLPVRRAPICMRWSCAALKLINQSGRQGILFPIGPLSLAAAFAARDDCSLSRLLPA
jgi:hypothetical protein